jgi:hypothetical protein
LVDATNNRVNLVISGNLVAQIQPGTPLKFGLSFDGQSLVTTARFFWPTASGLGPQSQQADGSSQTQTSFPPPPPTNYPQQPTYAPPPTNYLQQPTYTPPPPTNYPQQPTYAPPPTNYPQQPTYAPPPPTNYPQQPLPVPQSYSPLPDTLGVGASVQAASTASIFMDRRVLIAAAAVVILAVGGIGVAVMSSGQGTGATSKGGAPTSQPSQGAVAAGTPAPPQGTPVEMFARGNDLRSKGQAGDAFLLFREAARAGHAPSAVAIGRMYDPVLLGQEPSPFSLANPAKAVEWYKQARDQGSDEAGQRLAQLVEWLKAKALANDTVAAEVLAGLQQ